MRSFLARALTGTALTAGMLAVGAGAAVADDTHTVERGETLSSIAGQYDAVESWRDLAEANRDAVPNPNLIHVGQELTVTGGSSDAVAEPTETSDSGTTSSSTSTSTHDGDVPLETWQRVAECESNRTWDINTGNTFYGGLQFNKMSWDWAIEVGGHTNKPAYPHNATKMQQIAVAETLLDIHPAGWGAWPACSSALGLR